TRGMALASIRAKLKPALPSLFDMVERFFGSLAGAPGFEPGNGGIKIRCLTTWLRPKRTSGKLTGMVLFSNNRTGSAPPSRLGRGHHRSGLFCGSTVGEETKAGGAAPAHPRKQRARQRVKSPKHRLDFGDLPDGGCRKVVTPRRQHLRESSGVAWHWR